MEARLRAGDQWSTRLFGGELLLLLLVLEEGIVRKLRVPAERRQRSKNELGPEQCAGLQCYTDADRAGTYSAKAACNVRVAWSGPRNCTAGSCRALFGCTCTCRDAFCGRAMRNALALAVENDAARRGVESMRPTARRIHMTSPAAVGRAPT